MESFVTSGRFWGVVADIGAIGFDPLWRERRKILELCAPAVANEYVQASE
jgi:hypothetical protein